MWTTMKAMIHGAGSLLDVTWSNGTLQLKSRYKNTRVWVKKHTRGIKRHFDSAYINIK